MPAPAASIITRALYRGQVPRYTQFALYELNTVLAHIAATIDFSAARGQWNFNFNPNLVTMGAGNIVSASPNSLPMDYLRVPVSTGSTGSQRSSKWYIQGVPYDMVEIDLTEWDDQVQQSGIQSYSYFWAKDMAQYQPVIEITGNLSSASQTVTTLALADTGFISESFTGASLSSIEQGMSISGGIGPNVSIVPGTTITGVTGSPPTSFTLSAAPTTTQTGATLLIGNPAQGFPYPPPSGAFPVMIRYQRQMPRLTQAQVDAGAYCWFPDDQVLIEGLAGQMMQYSGDSDQNIYIGTGLGSGQGRFGALMARYLKLADDNANRAQTVQLDRRVFGRSFSSLKNTKTVGW